MALLFDLDLDQVLEKLDDPQYKEFPILEGETTSEEFLKVFGDINWEIVNKLNQQYSHLLNEAFDLNNWINHNSKDELAYFIAEAGQNCFNYAERPKSFHLYLGKRGFILGIEQEQAFDPEKVDKERIKDNQGSAFEFYRNCKNIIFFDNSTEARIIYFLFEFD